MSSLTIKNRNLKNAGYPVQDRFAFNFGKTVEIGSQEDVRPDIWCIHVIDVFQGSLYGSLFYCAYSLTGQNTRLRTERLEGSNPSMCTKFWYKCVRRGKGSPNRL